MLACDETITLVRYDGEAYNCTIIEGVSWFCKTQLSVQDSGVVAADVVTVRIPENHLPEGVMPEVGDFMVHGEVLQVDKRADLEAYTYASVVGVGDNRRGILRRHVVVTGK